MIVVVQVDMADPHQRAWGDRNLVGPMQVNAVGPFETQEAAQQWMREQRRESPLALAAVEVQPVAFKAPLYPDLMGVIPQERPEHR